MESKTKELRFYILVGEKANWKISLEHNIWGFSETSKGLWNKSDKSELVAFYVTRPEKKIVGFGEIIEKFIDENLLWDDEKRFQRCLWKYKLKFKIIYKIDDFSCGISVPNNMILRSSRTIIDKETFLNFVKDADEKWETELIYKINKMLKKE